MSRGVVPGAARHDPTAPWWRRIESADRRALIWLVAVPVALFALPALVGHPALQADNLIQNFPLRALAGRQIRSGHLPLLNPYANSGTPLLGGLNAGALFPGTLLFVVLPALAAWVLNLIAVYVVASVGLYALARHHRIGSLGALAGALVYTYLGAMLGQIVHLGVVQGFALLPWAALAMTWLGERVAGAEGRGWPWRAARAPLLALSALWALNFLTGEPRAYAEFELLTVVLVPMLLLVATPARPRTWRGRVVVLLATGLGVLWGAAVALAQLLPGWSFIGFSQRSSISYWFFGSGSLSWKWTGLLALPNLFGGNGVLGPDYFSSYNLPEVTGYVGLVALAATGAFLARLTRRGWGEETRDLSPYLAVGVVGLFATWGDYLVTGHLFRLLPFFGSTRLQSRNVVLVDLVGALLSAWWIDRLAARDWRGASLTGARRAATVAGPALVLLASGALALWGVRLVEAMGLTAPEAASARHLAGALTPRALLALALVALVLGARRLRHAARWAVGLVALDVALFVLTCATGLTSSGFTTEPSRAQALAAFGGVGRTAVVDRAGGHYREFIDLGAPNTNVFTEIPSVQGYGSLISTIYDTATGTHQMNLLNPCSLRRGTFTQLRLGAIAVANDQLTTPVGGVIGAPAWCAAPPKGPTTQRYFGQVLHLASVSLRASGPALARGPLRVTALGATGRPLGPAHEVPGAHHALTLALTGEVAALRIHGSHLDLADTVVTTTSGERLQLDTPFEYALAGRGWHLTSTPGDFAIVQQRHVKGPAWIARGASGRVTHVRVAPWGDSWVSVTSTRATTVLRSSAYLPGWRASAVSATGGTRELTVTRHGLILAVAVPAGTWTIHLHYHAPHIELALAGSAVASAGWLAAVGLLARDRRRRRATMRP